MLSFKFCEMDNATSVDYNWFHGVHKIDDDSKQISISNYESFLSKFYLNFNNSNNTSDSTTYAHQMCLNDISLLYKCIEDENIDSAEVLQLLTILQCFINDYYVKSRQISDICHDIRITLIKIKLAINPLDVSLLLYLIKQSENAIKDIADKNVILLLGVSGAGLIIFFAMLYWSAEYVL